MSVIFDMGGRMSYEQKGVWVYLAAVLGAYGAYVAFVLGRAATEPLTEVSYAPAMLGAIGVSMALTMFGRVAVEIVRPSDSHRGDVRDRDINRYGEYIGFYALSVALLPVLILTMLQVDHFWIANGIYAAFTLNALVSSVTKLVAYQRGL